MSARTEYLRQLARKCAARADAAADPVTKAKFEQEQHQWLLRAEEAEKTERNFMTRSSREGRIAKTGATLRSVRKKLQGRVRGAAGDFPAEFDEPLAAASALLWWCDCNVNSEKRRAGKAPSRLYGTGSWAGGNRGRRAGEDGSWLFPVKGIPAHSPRGASTRKTRAMVQRETVKQAKRPRACVTARRPCLLTRRRRLRRDQRFLRASTIASGCNNPKQKNSSAGTSARSRDSIQTRKPALKFA